ncbi:baseplate hub [Halorubrum sodomense tailed virus 4]|uniref:Baseplate hub n=1 Tax=Halorubrum sodomense tailed virus 4 TaxID=2878013 RepID=A0AAE9BWK2_9CAUD|nr:baseplate hub [Halorubrum sodomense tailed virus 4]UBF19733.1 baseplate hub [Halorubrum virus HRTV-18]UBF19856.1 baseplate hub [Halorubrum virus HRTV-20]UBF19980.1 baseplate hub [Halorubrum virus HRTV-22]UBF20106.1 baseplate hub [Halorubrum virus HRTV-26]UBF20231.1 baseplate hub [Halorubrum sodomense tailed virus 4]
MNCEDANISIAILDDDGDFQNPLVEIRPLDFNFQRNRGQFDYVRAKFSQGVADHIQESVQDEDGALHRRRPALIKFGDIVVHRMLYLPDAVQFGANNVHIELHDVQKHLDIGVVDYQRQNVTLEEAYRYVFNQRDTSTGELFSGIEFAIPNSAFERVIAMSSREGRRHYERAMDKESMKELSDGNYFGVLDKTKALRNYEQEENLNIIKSNYALDFKQVTPWEAILEMNEKFGVTTWVAPDGKFWVGSRGATGIDHVAAPDDSRVWKLIDYNITPPRDPIMKVVVRGKMIHDPNESWGEQLGELVNMSRGTKDYRAEGVAERPDLDFGRIVEPEDLEVAADGLEHVAKRRMKKIQRDQWSGNLEILPSHSGTEWTDIRKVQVGDNIVTVPPENAGGECGTNIRREAFNITGVNHILNESGEWVLRLDVVPLMDGHLDPEHIKSYMRYFDPHKKEYISEEAYEADKKADEGIELSDFI